MRKLAIVFVICLFAIGFAACSQGEDNGKVYELEGLGVDELISLEIPAGYEESDLTQNGAPGAEILSQSWAGEDSSVRLVMLSFDGKGVLGMNGSIEDYISDLSPNAQFISLNEPLTDAFVTFAEGTAENDDPIENVSIEATFAYDKYVLGLELENTQEKSITEEQEETFYTILQSVAAREQ